MTKILNTLLTSIMRWHRRQSSIRALSALSNETLKDMGLDRSEILSVATELASEMPGSRMMTHRLAEDSKRSAAASGPAAQESDWKAAA